MSNLRDRLLGHVFDAIEGVVEDVGSHAKAKLRSVRCDRCPRGFVERRDDGQLQCTTCGHVHVEQATVVQTGRGERKP